MQFRQQNLEKSQGWNHSESMFKILNSGRTNRYHQKLSFRDILWTDIYRVFNFGVDRELLMRSIDWHKKS